MNYLISQFLQLLDNDGNPLTGGKIFVYKRGLPELADVYLDFEGHLNTNPVILDSTGHAIVIVDEGRFYDVIVQNKYGEQMWSMNNVSCIGYGEIIHREEVYHDDTLEGKGTEDEPLSVVGGGLSTVYTADPITGDGSQENPVTISDVMDIAHDDTMVHSYEGDNLVLGVNPSKFVAAGQKVDNAANADYATKAKNDNNGNDIASTYAKKSEIPDIPSNILTEDDLILKDLDPDLVVTGIKGYEIQPYSAKYSDITNSIYDDVKRRYIFGEQIALKSEIPDIPDLSNYAQKDGTYNDMTVGHANTADTANAASTADWATAAGTATSATEATHATNADNATNAGNAINATNATNAINATNATNDSEGNNIASTYATKSEIPSTDNFATKTDLAGYYPVTGGAVNGKVSAKGTGSASKDQSAVVYAQVTNTNANNQSGLGTNGSVWAGDYGNTVSQTIGVRRKIGDKRLAGRFQLYSDGNVSFQQISNNGTADSITCQLQYGETTSGNNWGTMTFGTETKHIAYKEDMETVLWENWDTPLGKDEFAVLPESIKNFEIIKFVTRETLTLNTATWTSYTVVEVYNLTQPYFYNYLVRTPTGDARLTWIEEDKQLWKFTDDLPIFKIIGVNRKAGN